MLFIPFLIFALSSQALAVSWSPAGDAVLIHDYEDGLITIRYVDEDRPDRVLDYSGCAKWSPQGDAISLKENSQETNEIFILNADGSGGRSIFTHGENRDEGRYGSCAHWSPDGERLAITYKQYNPPDSDAWVETIIYTMNRDGSALQEISRVWNEAAGIEMWVREGIVYSYFRGLMNTYQTYYDVLNPEGGARSLRAIGDYYYGRMVFSTATLDEGIWVPQPEAGIYMISVASGNLTKLSDYYPCGNPSWAPNGKLIVFTCLGILFILDTRAVDAAVTGPVDIYRKSIEPYYSNPNWSPRGDKIAVWYKRPGQERILKFLDAEIKPYGADVATPVQRASWGEVKKKMKGPW